MEGRAYLSSCDRKVGVCRTKKKRSALKWGGEKMGQSWTSNFILHLYNPHGSVFMHKREPSPFLFFYMIPPWTPSRALRDPQASCIIKLQTLRKEWENSGRVCFPVMALPLLMSRLMDLSRCTNEGQTHYIAHRLCFKCRAWKAADSTPVN